MQPSSAPLEPPANIARLAYNFQFDKYMARHDMTVPSAMSPSDELFSSGYCPQTPTLSSPDTPTTAGPTSPGPLTPNTPSFVPPYPGHTNYKHEGALDAAAPPKRALLLHNGPAFGAQRGGESGDVHSVSEGEEEEEGQEIIIPEPRAALLSPLRLLLSPPRSVAASANKLKVHESYASLTSAHTSGDLHHENFDTLGAYKPNAQALSTSTTTVGADSFETGMFEMLTPNQGGGVFDPLEPALSERADSILCPLPADTPLALTADGFPPDGSPPTSTASDLPSSNSSERPLILRRHRPPPMSTSQDLNGLVGRSHVLHDFLRCHDYRAANPHIPAQAYQTPPRRDSHGKSDGRVVSEGRIYSSAVSLSASRSVPPAPRGSSRWFPPSGPDSPIRFASDSPVPLTPPVSPPLPGEFIKRHRPRSVRSISPMHLDDSFAMHAGGALASADSGIEGMDQHASELLFPLPPTKGHRRQLAMSLSFQALDESDVDVGTSRVNSRSVSPPAQSIATPQGEYKRRSRLPDWATRPEIVVSRLDDDSDIDGATGERGGELEPERTKKEVGFWKTLSTSASGLFTRKDKAPHNVAKFEAPTPKKRILPSLSGMFRRREPLIIRPSPSPARAVTRLEVWPRPHRRTSSCSDPSCLFHPQHPMDTAAAMSFASSPTSRFAYDLGDTEGTFLPDLGSWGFDGAAPSTWGFDSSRSVSAEETGSSVRIEGERMLQGILGLSGNGRGSKKSGFS